MRKSFEGGGLERTIKGVRLVGVRGLEKVIVRGPSQALKKNLSGCFDNLNHIQK